MAFYWSVPRERVKDRLETALSADVTTGQPLAIGMDVDIGDVDSLKLFTGLGFKASDIVLRTRPITPNREAGALRHRRRAACGSACSRRCSDGRATRSTRTRSRAASRVTSPATKRRTKATIEIDKLVLNGVPGIQQAVGGLPVDGTVSGKLDVAVPKNLLANANGTIDVDIEDLAIGDGKAKLTVPSDPFLAAGVTVPRIKLGKLSGQIVIEKGRARFEGVRVHSADGDATLEGYVELRDPIGASQMHAYLKFRPSEALIKREATIELLTNALAGTAKRSDGYLGIQLTGPLAAIFLPAVQGSAVRRDHAQRAGAGALRRRRRAATPAPPPPSAAAVAPPPSLPGATRAAAAGAGSTAWPARRGSAIGSAQCPSRRRAARPRSRAAPRSPRRRRPARASRRRRRCARCATNRSSRRPPPPKPE